MSKGRIFDLTLLNKKHKTIIFLFDVMLLSTTNSAKKNSIVYYFLKLLKDCKSGWTYIYSIGFILVILTLGCRVSSRGRIRHRFTKERLNVGFIKIIHNYYIDNNMKYCSNITNCNRNNT